MDQMIATISAQEATPKPSTLQGFFSSFPFFSGQQFGNVNDRWFCTSNNNQVTEIETSSSDKDDEDEEEDDVLDSFLPPSFFAPAENEHDVVDETAAVYWAVNTHPLSSLASLLTHLHTAERSRALFFLS